jgi:hypothetical protein
LAAAQSARPRWGLRIAWLLAVPGFVMLATAALVLIDAPRALGCATNILSTRLVHCPGAAAETLVEPLARLGWITLIYLPSGSFAPALYSVGFTIWRLVRRRA